MPVNNSRSTTQVVHVTPGLWSLGIITGIIFCILQGTGVFNIGWFWATFPFWIVPAASVGFVLVAWMILAVIALIGALTGKW